MLFVADRRDGCFRSSRSPGRFPHRVVMCVESDYVLLDGVFSDFFELRFEFVTYSLKGSFIVWITGALPPRSSSSFLCN